jgi:transcription initiation factor TFIIIB Brf1 subunit/transcription initiation factor TFIIB
MGFIRTLQELSVAADTPLSAVAKCIGFYVFTIGVRNRQPEPEAVIARIANALELGRDICGEAERIYERLRGTGLTAGRRPRVVASAAIYLSCRKQGLRFSAARIARAAGVSDVTVRKLVKAAGSLDGLIG